MTADLGFMEEAACKGYGDLFYASADEALDPGPALALCRRCPVLEQCRTWAIGAGEITHDGRAVHGVVAGVAPGAKMRPRPSMRPCRSCERLFVGDQHLRYCSDGCRLTARAAQKRADVARRKVAS